VNDGPAIEDTARSLSPKVAALAAAISPRANSIIVTVFGDAIAPRGGNIWLGSLIALLAPLGLSARLVRTGVYRLTQDGWFTASHKGRRSYYALSKTGQQRFTSAEQRIYASGPQVWDNAWTMVHFTSAMNTDQRQALRRELRWLGFGQLSRSMNAYPSAAPAGLEDVLRKTGTKDKAIIFHAHADDAMAPGLLQALAADAWDQSQLNEDYQQFLDNFATFANGGTGDLSPLDAFCLRVLLIHDYRRILLKDPDLPDDLLPAGWVGGKARRLCAQIYQDIHHAADAHATATITGGGDDAPPLGKTFWQRFGGLAPAA